MHASAIIINAEKRLLLENRYIKADIALEPFFRLDSLSIGPVGEILATQSGHTLVFDRQSVNLAAPGAARLRGAVTGETDPLYEASGVTVELEYAVAVPSGELTITRRVFLYDHAPALRWYDTYASTVPLAGMYYSDLGSCRLAAPGGVITAVDLFCCTDQSNRRLRELPAGPKSRGGFLICPDGRGSGIFLYKEGPFPDGQPIKGEYDFLHDETSHSVTMVGLGFDKLRPGESRRANGTVIGLLEEEHSLLGLHRYQLARYRCETTGEIEVLANSWPVFLHGVTEEKIGRELEAAAASGVTNLFIDDGWFEKFMGDIDRRKFPNGFTVLSRRAAELNINLGLWMNPLGLDAELPEAKEWDGAECHDSIDEGNDWNWLARSNDFRGVEYTPIGNGKGYYAMDLCHPGYFAHIRNKIVAIYREYGIKRFKFDLYQLQVFDTLRGDAHIHFEAYRQLLDELKREIPGLVISMDVTRNNRPNFDFGLDFGRLFLENRGRKLKDHRFYQPYISLRNLWYTLKYAPARKLEIEFMPQIDDYPLEYVLGTGVFANPLYWGALADLPETRAAAMKAFFARLEPHRQTIMQGLIFPVGDLPDLGNWTAIVSLSAGFPEQIEGYIGVYRNGAANARTAIAIPLLQNEQLELTLVEGEGQAEFSNGQLKVAAAATFSFQLYQFKAGVK